jgi:hypothetical protein
LSGNCVNVYESNDEDELLEDEEAAATTIGYLEKRSNSTKNSDTKDNDSKDVAES